MISNRAISLLSVTALTVGWATPGQLPLAKTAVQARDRGPAHRVYRRDFALTTTDPSTRATSFTLNLEEWEKGE